MNLLQVRCSYSPLVLVLSDLVSLLVFLLVKAMEAIGRNPEAAPVIQTNMILAIVFTEAIAIYALVVALLILFVQLISIAIVGRGRSTVFLLAFPFP